MLEKFLQEKLPYPPDEVTLIFYNICVEQNNTPGNLVYNSKRYRLEYPLSEIGSNWLAILKEKAFKNGRFTKQSIEGTKICWWLDSDKLCFTVK